MQSTVTPWLVNSNGSNFYFWKVFSISQFSIQVYKYSSSIIEEKNSQTYIQKNVYLKRKKMCWECNNKGGREFPIM